MKKYNVLITGCGRYFMKNFVLDASDGSDYDVDVFGADMSPDWQMSKYLKMYFKTYSAEDERYFPQLLEICKENRIDVLIPTLDAELLAISQNKHIFDTIGCKIAICSPKTLKIVADKVELSRFLATTTILAPHTEVISDADDFKRVNGLFGDRFVIKIAGKAGSRGVRVVDRNLDDYDDFANNKMTFRPISFAQAVRIVRGKPDGVEMIVQEYLEGNEYSVNLVADNGNVVAISGKENIDVVNSTPIRSVSKIDEVAFAESKMLSKMLHFNGNVGIDFIYHNGAPYLTEINPRTTATMGLDAVAGINTVRIGIDVALGMKKDYSSLEFVPGKVMEAITFEQYR